MLTGNFISLGDRLRHQLEGAIAHLNSPHRISLKGTRGGLPVGYRCAIALKLDPRQALAIAEDLANSLDASDYKVSVTPPGLLDISIRDRVLAEWLQTWADGTVRQGSSRRCRLEEPGLVEIPFVVQYAHARCQSLLRLGEREGWIRLENAGIVAPQPLPWLASEGHLCISHQAEARLIAHCVTVADAIALTPEPDSLKLLMGLSAAFEEFYRDCPPAEHSPVRLGLLSVTGALLYWLLEIGLGVEALSQM
ncbi:MAG: hypothetical protein JJU32_18480 [Phormidium sp. BM_Day4_Bin.17]|nr:hypothetical protein [Phormidium sp. BM_Day4_Bin.17]UCJ11243.1 MAG: hypothetical protein JWS08_15870 [Phormidium sp. PBR-2020]